MNIGNRVMDSKDCMDSTFQKRWQFWKFLDYLDSNQVLTMFLGKQESFQKVWILKINIMTSSYLEGFGKLAITTLLIRIDSKIGDASDSIFLKIGKLDFFTFENLLRQILNGQLLLKSFAWDWFSVLIFLEIDFQLFFIFLK